MDEPERAGAKNAYLRLNSQGNRQTYMAQSTLDDSARDTNTFYRRTLHVLSDARVPFLVGGSHAYLHYTGIVRNTKDFDLFVRRSDLDRVHEIAHTLKSTSAAVGAERLAELCADIERQVRGVGLAGSVEPLLARLIGECERAEHALQAELEAGPLAV